MRIDRVNGGGDPAKTARDDHLRKLIRSQIVYYLQEDLDGGELYKETWEACEDDRERDVVRAELRTIIRGLSEIGS